MERSKTENRSAFAQAIKRRDGVMREMLGMGSDPVGRAEGDKHHEPQVGSWRVAGRRDRSSAGWPDPVGAQRRRQVPWLFLLSSFAKRNGISSLSLWSGKKGRDDVR
jgi:hypothetical protein